MGTRFDGDRLVDDVAFDPRRRGQAHLQAAYLAHDAAINHNVVCNAFALHGGTVANGQQMSADVAFDSAFNIDVPSRFDVASDRQIS